MKLPSSLLHSLLLASLFPFASASQPGSTNERAVQAFQSGNHSEAVALMTQPEFTLTPAQIIARPEMVRNQAFLGIFSQCPQFRYASQAELQAELAQHANSPMILEIQQPGFECLKALWDQLSRLNYLQRNKVNIAFILRGLQSAYQQTLLANRTRASNQSAQTPSSTPNVQTVTLPRAIQTPTQSTITPTPQTSVAPRIQAPVTPTVVQTPNTVQPSTVSASPTLNRPQVATTTPTVVQTPPTLSSSVVTPQVCSNPDQLFVDDEVSFAVGLLYDLIRADNLDLARQSYDESQSSLTVSDLAVHPDATKAKSTVFFRTLPALQYRTKDEFDQNIAELEAYPIVRAMLLSGNTAKISAWNRVKAAPFSHVNRVFIHAAAIQIASTTTQTLQSSQTPTRQPAQTSQTPVRTQPTLQQPSQPRASVTPQQPGQTRTVPEIGANPCSRLGKILEGIRMLILSTDAGSPQATHLRFLFTFYMAEYDSIQSMMNALNPPNGPQQQRITAELDLCYNNYMEEIIATLGTQLDLLNQPGNPNFLRQQGELNAQQSNRGSVFFRLYEQLVALQ